MQLHSLFIVLAAICLFGTTSDAKRNLLVTADEVEAAVPDSIMQKITDAGLDIGTLLAALDKANLTDAIANADGPLTVLAPSEEAFQAVIDNLGSVEAVLDLPNLGDILKFHVLDSKVMAGDITEGMKATTLLGDELTFVLDPDGGVHIEGGSDGAHAMVITPDAVVADQGVVHIIDAVMMPPAEPEPEPEPAPEDGGR